MRYHKAKILSKPEADRIIGRQTPALSDIVVISRGDRFYDVRAMTDVEIEAFVADLARAEYADLRAAAALPC
jgi:hypothetical protein